MCAVSKGVRSGFGHEDVAPPRGEQRCTLCCMHARVVAVHSVVCKAVVVALVDDGSGDSDAPVCFKPPKAARRPKARVYAGEVEWGHGCTPKLPKAAALPKERVQGQAV